MFTEEQLTNLRKLASGVMEERLKNTFDKEDHHKRYLCNQCNKTWSNPYCQKCGLVINRKDK